MEGNSLRIIITGILTTSMLMWGCPVFLHGDGIHVALSHHFFHANIFHLAVNSMSVWLLFRKGYRYETAPLIVAFICATISWYCSAADVVGFSNIIFAIVGLRTPSLSSSWWRQPATVMFFAVTLLMAFLPQVSAVTHLVSFVLGCLYAAAHRIITSISRDYARASYHK